jgi:site-specific DNA recombinase
MPHTNGHGPKRAILYARVSTDEQARSGYSLAQQIEALREYAAREGYEALEEVQDAGQSGASLERPGMDRVRDLVAGGGVYVVLAQDRDRIAREPAYHYLLRREFEEHGTKIRALNDRGDDSPEGELTDGILDQLAKFERAKIAERTRRGKLRKAREGMVIPTHTADYGFKFNDARTGYELDEDHMTIVRRIFRLVGVEGKAMHYVKKRFDHERIRPPKGGQYWSKQFIRSRILDDVYRPHIYDELKQLVSPEVAARLDPNKCYGVWWFNVRRITARQVAEAGSGERRYRRRTTTVVRPKEEWIAVPVPDAGIPREWVDAARAAISHNRVPSSAGNRFWELSGGVFYCGECGRRMCPVTVNATRGHHYYRCPTRQNDGKDACPLSKNFRADEVKPLIWVFVSDLLSSPGRLQKGLETMLEHERNGFHGDPEREAKVWLEQLADAERKRSSFQDMAAEGLITFDELRTKLATLQETCETARRELATLEDRCNRLKDLEQDAATLLESYAGMVPEALGNLDAEERNHVYKMLRLTVSAYQGGTLEVRGTLGSSLCLSNDETSSTPYSSTTSSWIPDTSTP